MPPQPPPSFHSQTYWDSRFSNTPQPFDWLLPPLHLHSYLHTQISTLSNPSVLHIGCGTSSLSSHLCTLVPASKVCNVDYSSHAVNLGKQRQEAEAEANGAEVSGWRTLDLLSGKQVQSFAKEGRWDVVVDKSTADAISCGDDVRLSFASSQFQTSGMEDAMMVHPLYVLGIHLAVLTRTGGKWLVCSYSKERFGFWDVGDAEVGAEVAHWLNDRGVHPSDLWRLERYEGVVKSEECRDGVHRPPEMCYLYTLVRTEVEVKGV